MRRGREAGYTLILTAAGLVVLTGFMGLGMDLGVLRYEKRLQQTAADAAALAGASNLCNSGNCTGYSGVTAGAQSAAAADGFPDSGGGNVSACGSGAAVGTVCVQVINPPEDTTLNGVTFPGGPHAGNNNYVEVLVAEVHSTYFMKVLGINSETLTARAVASNLSEELSLADGVVGNASCLYTLGPPPASIEAVSGSGTLDAAACGISDDGNYDSTHLTVSANTFGVSGSGGGSATCATGPCPAYGMPAVADPLATVSPPTEPAASPSCPARGTCNVSTSGTETLFPGTYASLTIRPGSTVTFEPGLYYITGAGGLRLDGGGGSVSGSGVMFYFTGSASIDAVGLDQVDLKPPTSGQYTGMLFYQDSSDTTSATLGGTSGSIFGGISYFPSAELTVFGTGTNNVGIVIANAFALSGNPNVTVRFEVSGSEPASPPPGTDLLKVVTLVE
jgi:Putative Flp pilus-assembly TadE/G-like